MASNDLYTDYAIQIFSSYMKDDLISMEKVLDSFKNEGKNIDDMFMPGLIYGLMFHWASTLRIAAEASDTEPEVILEEYAMHYALIRDQLIDNPLLNVDKARNILHQLLETMDELNRMLDEGDY